MNLYSRKQRTKLILFLLATTIVGVSLWYSNRIVQKIRSEERQKVQLWSEAIQKRAKLVNYTQKLFDNLRMEERKKVNLWFSAVNYLIQAPINANLGFVDNIIADNHSIPIVVVDDQGQIVTYTNLDQSQPDSSALAAELSIMKRTHKPLQIDVGQGKQYLYYRDSKLFRELQQTMDDLINSFISETVISSASVPVLYMDSSLQRVIASGNIDSSTVSNRDALKQKIESMRSQNEPLVVRLNDKETNFIFYEDSFILTQLKFYPYYMLTAIGVFLIVSYLLFSTFRNAEQNQVWVGMAKETAHQLGTPLSSLMAWVDLLKLKGVAETDLLELQKDLSRLQVITDRFSKIGSKPELETQPIAQSVEHVVEYLRPRISKRTTIQVHNQIGPEGGLCKLNAPLFEWVIENLCKNAVDAMNGDGQIDIHIKDRADLILIDIRDTGKGIPKHLHKTVFEPGYTTKKRGWGLGLSLCKRIIEKYHGGSIFVKGSENQKGTTFRIALDKA
ncbi:MAG TPA: HAMP domain-containing sensor histidine kinase [Luteibaculaceae bacterium]|nr:HAMP domain-containing sensor histidine kinase [Luteibaculaceae bacterium]